MSKLKSVLSQNTKSLVGALFALVLPLLGSSLSLYCIYEYPTIINFFKDHILLFAIVTSFTMGVLLTPTTFIASVSGYLFGVTVIPILVIAYTLSSFIGFLVGKILDGGIFMRSITEFKEGEKFRSALMLNPYLFVVFCRISPVLPFGLMNLALPSLGVRLKPFLIAGTMGMLPRTILFVWLGSTARTVQEALQNGDGLGVKLYITIGLVVCSTVGLLLVFKKMFK